MPSFDPIRRSVSLKFVYYGPSGAGKTASLQLLDRRIRQRPASDQPWRCSRPGGFFCFDSLVDRTTFFDSLALVIRCGANRQERLILRLVSVPGEPMHRHTRRLLLRGADGVVLVGDRPLEETSGGGESSLAELRTNLRESGICVDSIPLVQQASPLAGGGCAMVVEALRTLLKAAWPSVEHILHDRSAPGFDRDDFLAGLQRAFAQPAAHDPTPVSPTDMVSSTAPRRLAVVWDAGGRPDSPRVAP
jgi:hypothetical protein